MTITLWLFVRRSWWLVVVAAACWAVLTANSGWGFFACVLPILLLWQWYSPLVLPAVRWRYFLPLLGLFLRQLVMGGLDVAGRALMPQRFDRSGFAEFETRLSTAQAQMLFASLISLLPGTCTVSLQPGGRLQLHLLDTAANWQHEVLALEQQLALLFAESDKQERV